MLSLYCYCKRFLYVLHIPLPDLNVLNVFFRPFHILSRCFIWATVLVFMEPNLSFCSFCGWCIVCFIWETKCLGKFFNHLFYKLYDFGVHFEIYVPSQIILCEIKVVLFTSFHIHVLASFGGKIFHFPSIFVENWVHKLVYFSTLSLVSSNLCVYSCTNLNCFV